MQVLLMSFRYFKLLDKNWFWCFHHERVLKQVTVPQIAFINAESSMMFEQQIHVLLFEFIWHL